MKNKNKIVLLVITVVTLFIIISGCNTNLSSHPPLVTPTGIVTQGTVTPQNLTPSLSVGNFYINDVLVDYKKPPVLKSNKYYNVRYEVVNEGPGDIEGDVPINIDYLTVNENETTYSTFGSSDNGSVSLSGINKISKSTSLTFWPLKPGTYTLHCVVDPENKYGPPAPQFKESSFQIKVE
jgi:hypothetical protein